jgi:predicted CoA-binding protein
MTTDKARGFLDQKRFAVVGVSRLEKDFSRTVFQQLRLRGYDVVPVNPALSEVEGCRCYARLQDIEPPVSGALLMTPSARAEEVARDCIEAGIRNVWMHRGVGAGAASPAAVELCRTNGIEVVTDLCPFMVLPDCGWPHRVHGFFRRLTH